MAYDEWPDYAAGGRGTASWRSSRRRRWRRACALGLAARSAPTSASVVRPRLQRRSARGAASRSSATLAVRWRGSVTPVDDRGGATGWTGSRTVRSTVRRDAEAWRRRRPRSVGDDPVGATSGLATRDWTRVRRLPERLTEVTRCGRRTGWGGSASRLVRRTVGCSRGRRPERLRRGGPWASAACGAVRSAPRLPAPRRPAELAPEGRRHRLTGGWAFLIAPWSSSAAPAPRRPRALVVRGPTLVRRRPHACRAAGGFGPYADEACVGVGARP